MVYTTLDFAEKYLLNTEIRTVAAMPDDDAADDEATARSESFSIPFV